MRQKKEQVPYLNINDGQRLEITEKFLDSIQGNYSFNLEVLSTVAEMPDIGRNISFYTLPLSFRWMNTTPLSRTLQRIALFIITEPI